MNEGRPCEAKMMHLKIRGIFQQWGINCTGLKLKDGEAFLSENRLPAGDQNMNVLKKHDTAIEIVSQHEKLWTTSLDIAEKFGKRHDNVIRDIENLDCSPGFKSLNFEELSQTVRGGTQKYYIISRDGFSFLAMGFRGAKAAEWKERFIEAFSKMEDELKNILMRQAHHTQRRSEIAYQAARAEGKLVRKEETDTIKVFVEYATSQGSKHPDCYYTIITTMVNKHLFFLEAAIKPENLRDWLGSMQLIQLSVADNLVSKALIEGIAKGMFYKDIYRMAKKRVIDFSKIVGQSYLLPCEGGQGQRTRISKIIPG